MIWFKKPLHKMTKEELISRNQELGRKIDSLREERKQINSLLKDASIQGTVLEVKRG